MVAFLTIGTILKNIDYSALYRRLGYMSGIWDLDGTSDPIFAGMMQ